MTIQKIGALTMILGSMLSCVGLGLPVSTVVFMTRDPAKRLATISASLTQWNISQFLIGLGSFAVAFGVALVAFSARSQP